MKLDFHYTLSGFVHHTRVSRSDAKAALRQNRDLIRRKELGRVTFFGLVHVRSGRPYDRLVVSQSFSSYDALFERALAEVSGMQTLSPEASLFNQMMTVSSFITEAITDDYERLCQEALEVIEAREREREKIREELKRRAS